MKLFEYVVLYLPREGEEKTLDEANCKIILDGKLLAATEQQAVMKISRMLPETYIDLLSELEVSIRPF